MMTSAKVYETSVTCTENSPFKENSQPNDQKTRSNCASELKPFYRKGRTIAAKCSTLSKGLNGLYKLGLLVLL